MAKSSELNFSVGREERSLILIANFVDGYSSDFIFKIPTSFKDALDIKLTPRMIRGKTINIYSQGKNYSFKQGDVIYDAKEAYTLEWGEALGYINNSIQVIDSRDATTEIIESYEIKNTQIKHLKKGEPEKIVEKDVTINKFNYDPGYVKFRLLHPDDKKEKLIEKTIYECSQENFVLFLQSGVLRTLDKQEIYLTKAQHCYTPTIMKYSGDIGEEIVSNFFDESFSDILCFPNPKTKNNAQVADILLWLNRFIFLIEVKTFVSSTYHINDWARDRINDGVEQLEKNYDRILSNQEIFLNNKYYHAKFDCEGLSGVFGLIILVHDDNCTLKPSDICKNIYESKLPLHVFSWNKLQSLTQEIDTIPDFKYYLQDRLEFVKKSDIPLNKELDAIGLYKMGENSFPETAINFENSTHWDTYLSTMTIERKNRELDNIDSKWLDSFESLFTENRKLFNGIPLGLHFTWVFAALSRRERAKMGKKFNNVQKYFIEGKHSRYFAFCVPATGHWIVFYFSKYDDKEQYTFLRKMVDQKLIQLIEDENFQYAVFGIGIKVSSLYPPTIMGINAALLIGADVVKGTYSNDDIRLAKTVWGNLRSGEIEEFPSN